MKNFCIDCNHEICLISIRCKKCNNKFNSVNRGKTKENCEHIKRSLETRKKRFEEDRRRLLQHDYTGELVGNITVIKRTENKLTKRNKITLIEGLKNNKIITIGVVAWGCQCSCGKIFITTSRNLHRGQKSCGCLSKSNRFSKILSTIDGVLSRTVYHYKQSAISRKFCWELTREQAIALFSKKCIYCGGEGRPLARYLVRLLPEEYKDFKINGIYRKNNAIGYTKENSVSCCSICNRAKLNLTEKEFLQWINELIEFKKNENKDIDASLMNEDYQLVNKPIEIEI